MTRATISQVKNALSAYLKKVRAGQTVIILDRDEPIARIEPIGRKAGPDDRLTRLERDGLVRRGTGRVPARLLGRAAGVKSKRSVLAALLEERREGR